MKEIKVGCFEIRDHRNKKNYPVERKLLTLQEKNGIDRQWGRSNTQMVRLECGHGKGRQIVWALVQIGWEVCVVVMRLLNFS